MLITLRDPERAADPATGQAVADALARLNERLDPRERIETPRDPFRPLAAW